VTGRHRPGPLETGIAAGLIAGLIVGFVLAASAPAFAAPPARVAAAAAAPPPPPAAASKVAVVRPAAGDPVLEEASLRIRSELDAAGMSNRLVDCPGPAAPDRPDCADSSSAARIALGREDGIATIQVIASLPDGLELRRHVRVPPEQGGDDPSVIAVRAVELLRDIYLDIPRVARRPPPDAAGDHAGAPREGTPSAAPSSIGGRAFAGAGVLQGRWGLRAAAGPTFGFGMSFLSRLTLLATLAGPFHTSVGSVSDGMAETWQTLAVAQLRYEIGPPRFRPYAAAGAGLFSLTAQGQMPGSAGMPALTITGSQLSPLVTVGVGVLVKILPWLGVAAEVHEMVTMPALEVRVNGVVKGRAGAPSELVELGLVLCRP
jgi:hypothetical protein